MKWTTCATGLLLLVGFPVALPAQAAQSPRVPFDCPMPVVGSRARATPPSVAQPGATRPVPMPTLRRRCFNPLEMKVEPPVDAPALFPGTPKLLNMPQIDRRLVPDDVDRFRLDGSLGLTPPRGE